MTETEGLRFATKVLELYGNEKVIDVSIDRTDEIPTVVKAFESLGCRVTVNAARRVLTVFCGESA